MCDLFPIRMQPFDLYNESSDARCDFTDMLSIWMFQWVRTWSHVGYRMTCALTCNEQIDVMPSESVMPRVRITVPWFHRELCISERGPIWHAALFKTKAYHAMHRLVRTRRRYSHQPRYLQNLPILKISEGNIFGMLADCHHLNHIAPVSIEACIWGGHALDDSDAKISTIDFRLASFHFDPMTPHAWWTWVVANMHCLAMHLQHARSWINNLHASKIPTANYQ